jgi:hypothetical protein
LDGRGLQVVEAGTGPQVQKWINRIGDQQAAPYQHADDAPAEGAEQLDQFRIAGPVGAEEGHALATEGVGLIQKWHVQVKEASETFSGPGNQGRELG